MARFGEVIGLPFAIEGFAFFVEAIFLGIYLYGFQRLPPRAHLLSGIPIVLGGAASAWLRGRRDRYHLLGFLIPFSFAAALTPLRRASWPTTSRQSSPRWRRCSRRSTERR